MNTPTQFTPNGLPFIASVLPSVIDIEQAAAGWGVSPDQFTDVITRVVDVALTKAAKETSLETQWLSASRYENTCKVYEQELEAWQEDRARLIEQEQKIWGEDVGRYAWKVIGADIRAVSATDSTHADLLFHEAKWGERFRYVMGTKGKEWVELSNEGIKSLDNETLEQEATADALQNARDARFRKLGLDKCPDVDAKFLDSLHGWDKSLGSVMTRRQAVVAYAMDKRAAVSAAMFDKREHHDWVSAREGLLNLKTGEVISHKVAYARGVYQRKMLGAGVTFAATTYAGSEFERWLWWFAKEDAAWLEYLQLIIGHALVGLNREQVFVCMDGAGGNGKGSFISMLLAVLTSNHVAVLRADDLLDGKRDSSAHRDGGLKAAVNSRFTVVNESSPNAIFKADVIKSLTGGDVMAVRASHQNQEQLEAVTSLIWTANGLPRTNDKSDGLKRRMVIIACDAQAIGSAQDSGIIERITSNELPVVLYWLRECVAKYEAKRAAIGGDVLKRADVMPARVRVATDAYFDSQDTMGHFINSGFFVGLEEYTGNPKKLPDGGSYLTAKATFEAYKAYSEQSAEQTDRQRASLTMRAFETEFIPKLKKMKGWDGVHFGSVYDGKPKVLKGCVVNEAIREREQAEGLSELLND